MPELPEVEVTRLRLEPHWVGRTIESVEHARTSYFFLTPPRKLRAALEGQSTFALDRHGKYLVATLSGGGRLLCHLGMTGQIFVVPRRSLDAFERTHVHLVLHLGGSAIVFRDARKFGKVEWIPKDQTSTRLLKLGIDALLADGEHLYQGTRTRGIAIKSVLLDQSVLAGVGNIYADEALFLAGIRPKRAARRLTRADCGRLAAAIQRVLRDAIRGGGSTISDFRHPDGSAGGYQQSHQVYGRPALPCPSCEATIQRVVIAGRSSHYCPQCQR